VRNPYIQHHLRWPAFLVFLALLLVLGMAVGGAAANLQQDDPTIIDDEDVPPGIAAGWIVGDRLLAEGKAAEALPYLHQAYRAHPEVVAIAMDFQEALAGEGYLRDALQVMDGLVAAYPDSTSFLMRRSALNLSAGRRDEALKDLREIRARGGASVDVLAAEASILVADGKISQGLDVLRDGLHLYPDRGRDIYLEMARIMGQTGQEAGIPALMDEALAEYADEPSLWMVKIRSLAALSLAEEALATAREADLHFAEETTPEEQGETFDEMSLEMEADARHRQGLPGESFAVELADYYAQNGQIDQALAILQPLSDQDELGLSPSLWLGRLLLGTGRLDEGVALVDRIVTKWPDAGRGWYLKGKIEEGQALWAEAIPFYRKAVDLDPYDPEIRLGLVRAMLVGMDGQWQLDDPDPEQEARIADFSQQVMTASTIVSEQDTEGQMLLGYAFRSLGDLERATWRFGLAAENPELRLQALIQKSICHDENGEEGKARSDLELLRREYPENPEVANSLGYFLAEKGLELEVAEDLVRQALAVAPGNGAYLDSLGWVMFRQGRNEEAFDYLIQAVNVLPDDPVILEHLGMVLMKLGQDAEALDVLQRAMARGGDSERIGALIAGIEVDQGTKE